MLEFYSLKEWLIFLYSIYVLKYCIVDILMKYTILKYNHLVPFNLFIINMMTFIKLLTDDIMSFDNFQILIMCLTIYFFLPIVLSSVAR